MNTDSPDLSPPPKVDFPRFFARKDRLVHLCVTLTLVSALVSAVSLLALIRATQRRVPFVMVGTDDAVMVCFGRSFEEAGRLHLQQALLTTTALLSRNARDFDQPEMIETFFMGAALERAHTVRELEAVEFAQKQIQQKPQVAKIEATETRPDQVLVTVTGVLLRVGTFQERSFIETVPFRLDLTLKPNPDLLKNHRQPTLVSDFRLTYENAR